MITTFLNFLNISSDTIFWISATLGTTLFLLRLAMSFFTGSLFEDDTNLDHQPDHHGHAIFKFLTVHSLSGFLMTFGWAGLACAIQFKICTQSAFLIALLCGVIMFIITALIMRSTTLLESPGDVFSTKKTIGLIGTVYQRIPANGFCKIHVVVNNITRELIAQSQGQTIESFKLTKIIKAIDYETVEVIEL